MKKLSRVLRSSALSLVVAATLCGPSGAALARTGASAKPNPAKIAPAQRQMNVLLIVSDDLSARIGSYGAPVLTPNIDRLAREGVRFDRAYVQFPWCAPSRASFLTGLRPDTVGVKDLQTHIRTTVPNVVTLPQYFRQNGYFSGRVGKIFHQGVPGDIGRSGPDDPVSWTEVSNPRGRDKDAEAQGRLVNLTPGIGLGSAIAHLADEGSDEEQTDGKVASEAIRMLQANRNRPFFIAAGFYRPHVPEVAPKRYFDLYPLSRIKIAPETPQSLAKVLPASRAWVPDNLGMAPDQQREAIQAYYAATSFMDAQVGRVLQAVRQLGLEKNTIIVFLSDHGYLLGEHGQWGKNVLWEEANRAPFIIRVPGAAGNGKASRKIVEFLDLYPTLLEAAGLPGNRSNQGLSLMRLLRKPNDARWNKPALSQVRGGRSVRTDRWRYTEWEGGRLGRELYDHRSDPTEHNTLAADPRHAAVVAKLSAMLPKESIEPRGGGIHYRPAQDCIALPVNAPAGLGVKCSAD